MRLLKKKIQASKRAQERTTTRPRNKRSTSVPTASKKPTKASNKSKRATNPQPKKRKRAKDHVITPKIYLQAKNIVTNFGKAMASFATSDLATPYLLNIIEQFKKEGHNIGLEDFISFMGGAKGTIGSIDSLRALVLEDENDNDIEILCKKIFKMVAEIFIKCSSVNWIIHGRVTYKLEHLKFRYKMLRRIRNPAMFTYLKGYSSKKEGKKAGDDVKEEI